MHGKERQVDLIPSTEQLKGLLAETYGDPQRHGWRVRMRHRFGYVPGDHVYEGAVDRLVRAGISWIDVGGGKEIFPFNQALAAKLAARADYVVGVDPSDYIQHNELVHDRVQCLIEDFQSNDLFDLATFRMVAEHIEEPGAAIERLSQLIKPGGHVVIYTPNRWTPVSVVPPAFSSSGRAK